MKKLEDMNLVDDFLMTILICHQEYGDRSVRYMLECILNRRFGKLTVVPQRVMCGADPEKHGIRMDVYIDENDGEIIDIEPDQNDGKADVKAVPRRNRFYHAKIDSANLAAGDDYSNLRNVVVIFITTYDPFGLDRMVYTVKNKCIEESDMPYDDGAVSLFLYTKGKKGNPPEELKSLLHYMENSIEENAGTDSLKVFHHMVTAVKNDGEVGLAYMKSVEIEKRIREEGREEGHRDGVRIGRIQEIVRLSRRFNKSDEEIIQILLEETGLGEDQARDALKKYS